MIRKLLRRVFLRGESAKRQAERIPASRHGIRREQVSTGARRTCEALQKGGFKAYVVGGAVRDLIAGIPPKDYDIATDATPEQVRGLFRRSRIIGRRFQIVHVMQGPETLEVSTFRAAHDEDTLKDEHGRVLRDNVWGSIEEDAVRREIKEEAGISCGKVTYMASQPWPFPCSLMIGCLAEAEDEKIVIDVTELDDARWFSREDALKLVEGRLDGFFCPPKFAIAHQLIASWARGEAS